MGRRVGARAWQTQRPAVRQLPARPECGRYRRAPPQSAPAAPALLPASSAQERRTYLAWQRTAGPGRETPLLLRLAAGPRVRRRPCRRLRPAARGAPAARGQQARGRCLASDCMTAGAATGKDGGPREASSTRPGAACDRGVGASDGWTCNCHIDTSSKRSSTATGSQPHPGASARSLPAGEAPGPWLRLLLTPMSSALLPLSRGAAVRPQSCRILGSADVNTALLDEASAAQPHPPLLAHLLNCRVPVHLLPARRQPVRQTPREWQWSSRSEWRPRCAAARALVPMAARQAPGRPRLRMRPALALAGTGAAWPATLRHSRPPQPVNSRLATRLAAPPGQRGAVPSAAAAARRLPGAHPHARCAVPSAPTSSRWPSSRPTATATLPRRSTMRRWPATTRRSSWCPPTPLTPRCCTPTRPPAT